MYLQKAKDYHRAVSSYDEFSVKQMVCEEYIQHNPLVPTGRAAFLELLPKLRNHQSKIENIRIFQDGSYVIMHHLWRNAEPFGADKKVAFHIIRFNQAGLIAEHWSVMTDYTPPNPSGRSLIDGQREIRDLSFTDKNKSIVLKLFELLTNSPSEHYERIYGRFFFPTYHQHNPNASDGIVGLREAISGGKLEINYSKQHAVFGAGNFVLSISEGLQKNTKTAFYDLFRLDNGMIAEHWSVAQEIPLKDLANTNTMFNF